VSTTTQPTPVTTRWSERFWEGTEAGEFLLQKCSDCGKFAGYPKVFCPHCYSDSLEWVQSTGRGTIYTFSTVLANPPSTFIDELPYTIVLVDLEEGVRFLSGLTDVSHEEIRVGMRVELVLIKHANGKTMPLFRPSAAS
jgi:uncharacterized OB-fold protein